MNWPKVQWHLAAGRTLTREAYKELHARVREDMSDPQNPRWLVDYISSTGSHKVADFVPNMEDLTANDWRIV